MPFPSFGEGKNVPTASGIDSEHAQPDHARHLHAEPSYLNLAVHTVLDPVAQATVGDEKVSDDIAGYACGFLKSLPLFMKGRLAVAGLIITHAADEARVKDSYLNQITDAGLGSAKGLVLKGTFRAFSHHGATPGMTGVGIGIASRTSDAALTRSNYFDQNNNFAPSNAFQKSLSTAFNPGSLAVDAITFGASDVLWARMMNHSRGAAWYRPEITHAISGASMGFSSEFGNQLNNQISAGQGIDAAVILKRSLLKATFDGVAGGLGGVQARRYDKLFPGHLEGAETVRQARSTAFQKGLIADPHQLSLRDGTFILDKKLTGLTTETWVGWTHTGDGKRIRSIFRPDNGSESFAHRMQTEIAAYGLQTLGIKMAVPTTVARTVELNGKTHSGYIQEMEGASLQTFVQERIGRKNARVSKTELQDLMRSNKTLAETYANAWLHRLMIGEWDNHALNMTVSQKAKGSAEVRNIDLGDSLRPAATLLDLTPTPGVRQGYDKINAHLYKDLSAKRLSSETLQYLRDIESRFSSPEGRSKLLAVGLTPRQAEGLLGRTNWLSRNQKMPANREALFYLHLNDARRAFERWYGKGKVQKPEDQTHYFE